jgi:uncharacterized protein
MSHAALIGIGEVRHARIRPARNRFVYPTYFLMLPMRSLRAAPGSALPRNRFGLISFFDRDHGDGRADSLAWLDELLAREGVANAGGEVWLQCYPRVLGFTFKPVSFWYCHRPDGTLAAVVVEVNNTFGERHCYLLAGPELGFGRELRATKVFHVSPFCDVSGSYRFRFMRSEAHQRIVARIDHHARRLLRHAADDAGRDRAHPLAGIEAVEQARAVLPQARTAAELHHPILSA